MNDLLASFELELVRRAAEKQAREQRAAQAATLSNPTDREIAAYLHAQEAEDARRAELERLGAMLREHAGEPTVSLSDRAAMAAARALRQGNYSALEALERELGRQLDDEDHAVLMLLLH